MIIVRDVFQAKWGKTNELVELFKGAASVFPKEFGHRILSDASGQFFTVVVETDVASIGEWERLRDRIFKERQFAEWFERSTEIVETGRREYWTVEKGE
jgi:hypothetical protein